jgi:hypothetical protein
MPAIAPQNFRSLKPIVQVYTVLPNREGTDFVAHLITFAHVQDTLLAQVNRTALVAPHNDFDRLNSGLA